MNETSIHIKAGEMRITNGVIHLGSITKTEVHFLAGPGLLDPVCAYDETETGTLGTFVTDWAKVTCKSCIEWRHA